MKILIEINIDNAAFSPDAYAEVSRILKTITISDDRSNYANFMRQDIERFKNEYALDQVRRISELPSEAQNIMTLRDLNGNKTGTVDFKY
jgi:hypothetical protein